jgi:HSP20 family protein
VVSIPFSASSETQELRDDVRELLAELASSLEHGQRAYSGECRPALDVRETEDAIEVVVDVAGVRPEAIRVLFRSGILLVVGEKAPAPAADQQTFHLVEREFGRFARAVRLAGALDIGGARATVDSGELLVVLPKRPERRGRGHRIPVAPGTPPPA